jgi:murein DD-endopeptidase MepM/ murein hydrolase activator NlpD
LLVALIVGGCTTIGDNERHLSSTPRGWPLPASCRLITSDFGPRAAATGGPSRLHQGLDVAAPKGTPIYATADGQVTLAERWGAYGRIVVLDHGNGYETRYAHLHRIAAHEGQHVRRGEKLGKVGRTGNATGYHLHYEVRQNGQPLNPIPFLR